MCRPWQRCKEPFARLRCGLLAHTEIPPRTARAEKCVNSVAGALTQECLKRSDIFLVPEKIFGDTLIEVRGAFIEFARSGIVADEAGNFLHFGDPSRRLLRHHRQLLLEPREHLLLAEGKLVEQSRG